MTEDTAFVDLIRRVRAGDEQASAELVRRYEPAIRIAVHVRLRDSALRRLFDSMDICQSVLGNFFVRAAAGQFDIDEPQQLLKLLVTMARNRLRDHARRPINRTPPAAEPSSVLNAAEGREETPSQIVAFEDMLRAVRSQFSESERYLADQRAQGRSWNQLAAELHSTPEALRKQLARAVERAARNVGLEEVGAG
jgi:RNA polymerase sigma factor (sigma-70 family)